MSAADLPELRNFLATERQLPDRAAGVEAAAGRRVERARHVALQHDARAAPSGRGSAPPTAAPRCRVQRRARRASRAGAISTMRPRYITATRSADVLHDRQVVRDEQVGEAEPSAAGPPAG